MDTSDADTEDTRPIENLRNSTKLQVEVRPSPLDYARSHSQNWTPPERVTPEEDAIQGIKNMWASRNDSAPEYNKNPSRKKIIVAALDRFEIYRSAGSKRAEYELTSLLHFDIKAKNISVDGFLCIGNARYYVEALLIDDISIEGYDDEQDPTVTVYIQSRCALQDAKYDIWYMLKHPACNYRRFHLPFIWVATFGKHALDYIGAQCNAPVILNDFQKNFLQWLRNRFKADADFLLWLQHFRGTDFRVAFHAYRDYLYHQAHNLDHALLDHPIWAECMMTEKSIIAQQPLVCEKTVASPFVYSFFKDMYFGKQLRKMDPAAAVLQVQEYRKRLLGFASNNSKPSTQWTIAQDGKIRAGEVVRLQPDEDETRAWGTTDAEWLAYVQRVEQYEENVQRLIVLWLYRAHDTTIRQASYPFKKELFLSDNCNCGKHEKAILSTDVVGRCSVDWYSTKSNSDYFVRQKYVTQEEAFVTLTQDDFQCRCGYSKPSPLHNYHQGDAFYYIRGKQGKDVLEPCVIEEVDYGSECVIVRRLLRLSDCGSFLGLSHFRSENELVWTNEFVQLSAKRIVRKCYIRHFPKQTLRSGSVPLPYNRRGNGDYWILSMQLAHIDGERTLAYLENSPLLEQSPGPNGGSSGTLKGLSMFSGGGNFDRGLEEGGAVSFTTAIDISPHAMHTQFANSQHRSQFKMYCGSVDDYLMLALKRPEKCQLIARIGEVDFIAAGSPCPGFSLMQKDWLSAQSLRNASHITSFCSYVDLYRPKYALLENVVHMTAVRKGHEKEQVLSHLISCLVGMGYQVNQFMMDSWNHGSAQRRSRLFLAITAPGLNPIMQPEHTHSHYGEVGARSLGKLANGQQFGGRHAYATPFQHVTARDVTCDLPKIGNGIVQACIPFPDHRLSQPLYDYDRRLIRYIPRDPPGQGYLGAIKAGVMPESLIKTRKKELGKAFCRIDKLIPTITTRACPQDSRGGASIHWDEHRPLSVQEARRTQGIPDGEILIGSTMEQWKLIGNGVDRQVALALGLSLQRALENSSCAETNPSQHPRKRRISFSSDGTSSVVHIRTKSSKRVKACLAR